MHSLSENLKMEAETKVEKISIAKANRKIAKPIMEKKRRARINASLNELKSLLVEVLQKEGCRHSSKMEKADILEMAVRHLKSLQRQQYQAQPSLHEQMMSAGGAFEQYQPCSPTECFSSSQLSTYCRQDLSPTHDRANGLNHSIPAINIQPRDIKPHNPNVTTPSAKSDMSRNILPAPQPMVVHPIQQNSSGQPLVTRTANGELAVVLPQNFLKSAAPGYLVPVYTAQQNNPESTKNDHSLMIKINVAQQFSPSNQNQQSDLPSAPLSPVWRPW